MIVTCLGLLLQKEDSNLQEPGVPVIWPVLCVIVDRGRVVRLKDDPDR